MKKILLVLCASLLLAACGGDSANAVKTDKTSTRFEAKVDDKDYSFDIKDALVTNASLPYVDKEGNRMKQGEHYIILGNYSFEGQPARTLKDGQIKVVVILNGEIGTETAPKLKAATYSTGTIAPMTVRHFSIITFQDGKENLLASSKFPAVQHKGEVKITSVEGDTVKGEINVTAGEKWSVKGAFTAKVLAQK